MAAETVDVPITRDLLPFGGGADFVATQIYPVRRELASSLSLGDALQLAIAGQQAHVVRLQGEGETDEPRIVGARHRLRMEDDRLNLDLWGTPGSSAEVTCWLPWQQQPEVQTVLFDGQPPQPPSSRIDGPHRTEGGYRVEIAVDVDEADGAQLQIYLDSGTPETTTVPLDGDELGDFRNPSRERWLSQLRASRGNWISEFGNTDHLPKARIRHDGEDGTGSTLDDDGSLHGGSIHWRPRTDPSLSHSWYLIDLTAGTNRVVVEVATAARLPRIGIWLERTAKLAHRVLRLTVPQGVALPPQLPQLRPGEERQTAEILSLFPLPIG